MQIYCPNCALQITIDEGLIGSKGQCPKCSYKFVIDQEHRHPPDADDLGTAPTIKIERGDDFDLGTSASRWVDSHSFVAMMAGVLLLVVSVLFYVGVAQFEVQPRWAKYPSALHQPFVHGALALFVAALVLLTMSRRERFAYLAESVPCLLAIALLAVFGANVSGAFAMVDSRAHAMGGILAAVLATSALATSFHRSEGEESDSSTLLICIALAIGAVIGVAYLGSCLAR